MLARSAPCRAVTLSRVSRPSTLFSRVSRLSARSPRMPRNTAQGQSLRRYMSTDKPQSSAAFDDSGLQNARDPFHGISAQPFPKDVAERLMQRIAQEDIEIRPDGLIYLPEIKYRRILNTAIGPGGWALMPRAGTAVREDTSYSREFALFCFGRFVAQARGEQAIGDRGFGVNLGMLDEAAKSNALMRCCKDLGIASELWDPAFIAEWKAKHAVDVWVEHVKTGDKRKLWRRKDRAAIGYPYKEVSFTGNAPNIEAPPVGAPDTFPTSQPYTGRSGGGGSRRQAADTSSASSSSSQATVDLDDTVPDALKKMRGKTWREVISTPEGVDYLKWATNPDTKIPAGTKELIKRVLAQKTINEFDKESGTNADKSFLA